MPSLPLPIRFRGNYSMRRYFVPGLVTALLLMSGGARADGDAAHGQQVYNKCRACHSDVAGRTLVGPSLFGIVGRTAGTEPGYAYSPGLAGLGFAWTDEKLDAWLVNPRAIVPGTKMTFLGLPNAQDRADLIAYLATLK